jgi:hypothetical protein
MAELIIPKVSGKKLHALEDFLSSYDIRFEKSSPDNLSKKLKAARIEKQKGTLKIVGPKDVWSSIL